ncbi:hypothetical protein B0H12DRAFT_110546 [Mycena haematopus]|nr:hypothetical protein B0H12DRAFT_110546 [Mycena haematopus]
MSRYLEVKNLARAALAFVPYLFSLAGRQSDKFSATLSRTTIMSTKRFPRRRPVDDPPLPEGYRVDNLPTPLYALGWVCDQRDFFMNIGGGILGVAHSSNHSSIVTERWKPAPGLECVQLAIFCTSANRTKLQCYATLGLPCSI